jgi:hypothetical protein
VICKFSFPEHSVAGGIVNLTSMQERVLEDYECMLEVPKAGHSVTVVAPRYGTEPLTGPDHTTS